MARVSVFYTLSRSEQPSTTNIGGASTGPAYLEVAGGRWQLMTCHSQQEVSQTIQDRSGERRGTQVVVLATRDEARSEPRERNLGASGNPYAKSQEGTSNLCPAGLS
jgi:hypothetical protein